MKILNITENNLKSLEFEMNIGELILVKGISGSGKSTLVKDVIFRESTRQNKISQKTDDLYFYTKKASFLDTTPLVPAEIIDQKPLVESKASSILTRTQLSTQLKKLFTTFGKVINKKHEVKQKSIIESIKLIKQFHKDNSLYFLASNYENSTFYDLQKIADKIDTKFVYLVDEKGKQKKHLLEKIKNFDKSKYEILMSINESSSFKKNESSNQLVASINGENYYFRNHLIDDYDGSIWRTPEELLFSKSTRSSHAGYCHTCLGKGKKLTVDTTNILIKDKHLVDGFIDLPLEKTGRYKGLKYKPENIIKLLKKLKVDVNKTINTLSKIEVSIIEDLIAEKIISNRSNTLCATLIREDRCNSCLGTGFAKESLSVQFNSINFSEAINLTSNDLLQFISNHETPKSPLTSDIKHRLKVIHDLSLGHLELSRQTDSLSSGENQRLKLFSLLTKKTEGKIIILDEPSSNLHYQDSLKIIDYVQELTKHNSVIIIDHNKLFEPVADKIVTLGPKAGLLGGSYIDNETNNEEFQFEPSPADNVTFKKFELSSKNNIAIKDIEIPLNLITTVVGSSGSGKSTLILDLLYQSMMDSNQSVVKIDNKTIGKNSRSIVATYLGVFDHIRNIFAKSSKELSESYFSFNSIGQCPECKGHGVIDDKTCPLCLGTRYKSEVSLHATSGLTINDVLNSTFEELKETIEFKQFDKISILFNKLSLDHISIGRETRTLSGGESQRLKLAKFILDHDTDLKRGNYFLILDEPSRGLDFQSIEKLLTLIDFYKKNNTVILIEHNPFLIYKSDYIIDLGLNLGIKTEDNITAGLANNKTQFPSLNHNKIETDINNKINLFNTPDSSHIETTLSPKKLNNKKYHLIDDIYKEQLNFKVIENFQQHFELKVPDTNVFFHLTEQVIRSTIKDSKQFFYNPFISYLYKFSKVPLSLFNTIKKQLKNFIVHDSQDPWEIICSASSFNEAYIKGVGIVILQCENGFIYHSTRLFSKTDKIIGQLFPISFDLYNNSCPYCQGYHFIQAYNFDLIDLDPNISIMDSSFKYSKIFSKVAINKFKKEQLFDFTKKIKDLTLPELNYLLYGFKEYEFLKTGKKGLVESDYIKWKGLNSYIYHGLEKIDKNRTLDKSIDFVNCPFCNQGYKKEFNYYISNNITIEEALKQKI